MSFETWAAYLVVETLLCLTPGPAVLFVVGQALWRGPSAAMRATMAVNAVNLLYFALSALGLAAVLAASHTAFLVMKWAGAAYLVFLGLKAIRESFRTSGDGQAAVPAGRPFVDGAIVQLSNPKAVLFFVAILPQFIDPLRPAAPQMAILAATMVAVETIVLTGYSLAAGTLRARLQGRRMRAWLDRAGGFSLLGVAAMTAAIRRA